MLISIIIPVYNSDKSLPIISEQVSELFCHRKEDYELIYVNDSPSNNNTCKTLLELKQRNPQQIHILEMYKNRGQQYALLCGFSIVKGDYIVTMDDDLQHPIEEIPKLIEAIKNKNVDLIFANPYYKDKKHNIVRNIGSWLLNKIDDLFLPNKPNVRVGAFRIFKREIVSIALNSYSSYPSISNLLLQASSSAINLKVEHHKREFGKSNYNFKKLLSLALDNLINYTSLPLVILGLIGILTFIASFIFILIVIIQKVFFSISMPGYASTVILISFFGSLNLLGIGIVGEYLIRIIREQHKPKLESLFTEDD